MFVISLHTIVDELISCCFSTFSSFLPRKHEILLVYLLQNEIQQKIIEKSSLEFSTQFIFVAPQQQQMKKKKKKHLLLHKKYLRLKVNKKKKKLKNC